MKIRFYKISCTSIEIQFDTAHSVQTVAESVSARVRSEKNKIENEIKIYSNELDRIDKMLNTSHGSVCIFYLKSF